MNIRAENIVTLKDAYAILTELVNDSKYHISQSEIQIGSGMTMGIEAPHKFNRIRLDLVYIAPESNDFKTCQ